MRRTSKVCACVADGVRCKQPVTYGDTLCRSCRLHHTQPFGPNLPRSAMASTAPESS